jgi:uncharacterized protein (TIGR02145 family)
MILDKIAEKVVALMASALAAALLLPAAAAFGQNESPFTVLATTSDLQNRKLYVEIMYDYQGCGGHQARFRLEDKSGLKLAVAVDSVLNNSGTYALSQDRMSLIRPKAGGYKLRFSLPKGAKASDSVRLCVESYELAYRCKGCGVGGSDAIFEPGNIHKSCPYKGPDMVACHMRRGTAGNWEGWIRDARDCKPYRIVLMSDGRWWLAQNLAYTAMITNSGNANVGLNKASPPNNNTLWGNYWCPGIPPRGVSNVTATSGQPACSVYGALYTWNTAMRRNGFSSVQDNAQPRDEFSQVQGICPEGWLLPSDFDWGIMLNTVEDCENDKVFQTSGTPPCNHIASRSTQLQDAGAKALPRLKSMLSCPPHLNAVDSICAETAAGAWVWRREDVQGKLSAPHNLGEDFFGFSMLPAGLRYGNGNASYFTGAGLSAAFWTSSEQSNDIAYNRQMNGVSNKSGVSAVSAGKYYGMSVRCLKNSIGDNNPRILRLQDVFGVNKDRVTFLAYTTFGTTVDWYDAPVNGRLLLAGSVSFSTNVPMRVYALARSINSGVVASSFVSARASFTYTYSGSNYQILLNAGVYYIACYGAKGANSTAAGGMGGVAEGMYETSDQVTAYVYVGGTGYTFNGAGAGGSVRPNNTGSAVAGGAGGGASDVRIGNTRLTSRIIVAGGGGGGGGRGSDSEFATVGAGGDQNTDGKSGSDFHTANTTARGWLQGGGGGGGGGYSNGTGGGGGQMYGNGGCRSGAGGVAGAAGDRASKGGDAGANALFGCAGGGGGGGTHYTGGVSNGAFKNDVNSGDGYVVITPQ